MRFAFYMFEEEIGQKMVGKLPKVLDANYNLQTLSKDLEAVFICSHIGNEFNDRMIDIIPDTRLLLGFVHNFIIEVVDKNHPYKYYYGENFI